MEITNIKTKDLELTDAINGYLAKRLKACDKFVPKGETAVICDVELAKTTKHHQTGPFYYAETNLTIAGEHYRATAQRETLYEAIDAMKDELQEELRRKKGKEEHLFRRGAKRFKDMIRGFRE